VIHSSDVYLSGFWPLVGSRSLVALGHFCIFNANRQRQKKEAKRSTSFFSAIEMKLNEIILVCNFITIRMLKIDDSQKSLGVLLSFNNFICDAKHKKLCTHLKRKLNYCPVRILNTLAPISINLQLSENHICVCIHSDICAHMQ
jgi:hypothetical protein